MAKRSGKKQEHDFSVTVFRVVQEATGQPGKTQSMPEQAASQPTEGKNPHAIALGRLGGKKDR